MTEMASGTIRSRIATQETASSEGGGRRWRAGLGIAAVAGTGAGTAGLGLTFLSALGATPLTTRLYTITTLLIGASFVLFGIAAHCFDRADAEDRALRIEYCRRHGLKD